MAIDDKIRDEELHYDINREAATIAFWWSKIDKYDCLTGEEILPSDQKRIIEQTKFTYSPLGKYFEKTNKNNWKTKVKSKSKHLKSMEKNWFNLMHLLENLNMKRKMTNFFLNFAGSLFTKLPNPLDKYSLESYYQKLIIPVLHLQIIFVGIRLQKINS